MVEVKRISYDQSTETLFVAFEDYDKCQGIGADASAYEVFEDMDLADEQGVSKIVAVEIFEMDHFDPAHADEIPPEFRAAVAEVYYQYRPDKQISASLTA